MLGADGVGRMTVPGASAEWSRNPVVDARGRILRALARLRERGRIMVGEGGVRRGRWRQGGKVSNDETPDRMAWLSCAGSSVTRFEAVAQQMAEVNRAAWGV